MRKSKTDQYRPDGVCGSCRLPTNQRQQLESGQLIRQSVSVTKKQVVIYRKEDANRW